MDPLNSHEQATKTSLKSKLHLRVVISMVQLSHALKNTNQTHENHINGAGTPRKKTSIWGCVYHSTHAEL